MRPIKLAALGLIFLQLTLLAGCVKNSIEIDVVKDGCRWLGIDNGQYDLIEDPCDNGNFKVYSSASHNEDTSCIQFLKVFPTFYNTANDPIPLSDVNRVYQGNEFFLSETAVAFDYDYLLSDQSTEETKANYMVLTYLIESEFENQSNELSLRIHFPCTVIDEDDYNVVNPDSIITVDPDQSSFPIEFWDNAAEDGDLIAAYVNGNTITDKLELFHEHKRFDVPRSWLNLGENDLVVFALNEGSSGPNTVSMSVNGKEVDLGSFAKGLRTGNAVRIDL
jgi:hypothetical protein